MTTLAILIALAGAQGPDRFVSQFEVDKNNLVTHGKNDFFILEPEYQLVLEGPDEKVLITVLEKTKMVDGKVTVPPPSAMMMRSRLIRFLPVHTRYSIPGGARPCHAAR